MWVYVLWGLLGLLIFSFVKQLAYHFILRRYPGPFPWPGLGNVPEFLGANKDLSLMIQRYQHLGPVFELWLPDRFLVINSPTAAQEVLDDKCNNFCLRPAHDDALKLLGMYHEGLVMNNDIENWKYSRGLFLRGLHAQFLRQIPDMLTRKWELLRPNMKFLNNADGAVNVLDMFKRIIADTVGEITLGVDFGACRSEVPEIVQLVNDWLEFWITCQYELPLVWKNPYSSKMKRLLASDARRKEVLEKLVQQCLANTSNDSANPSAVQPFVQLVCKAYATEGGSKLSLSQLSQTIFEMIVGGTDTSVNTMTYCLLLLAENPVAQEKLYEEINRVVGSDGAPGWKHVNELVYTEQVIRETFRHRPLHNVIIRRNQVDDTVAGLPVPANTAVGVRTFPNSDVQLFANPSKFDPDHFSTSAIAARPKGASSPFGWGTRQCPGMAFAMIEMKLLLAQVIRSYRVSTYKDMTLAKLKTTDRIVVIPLEPVWVNMTPR